MKTEVSEMKLDQINIRDPFVLVYEERYYMYGTRGETAFEKKAYGLDVYISEDMKDWQGPVEVFTKTDDFWADRHFWAPEVYHYRGAFYMFATFADKKRQHTIVLKADKPDGMFRPWSSEPITPEGWLTLDGTLYVDKDKRPYMVFCREWKQVKVGQIWAVELEESLKKAKGEPFMLFKASEARPLVKSFLFGRYVTDGPYFVETEDGRLHMLWSSYGQQGYVQLLAENDTQDLKGKFTTKEALYVSDGGHGMIFKDLKGRYKLVLHTPNTPKKEHPVFIGLEYKEGRFISRKDTEACKGSNR